jgi:hypothetical protein
VSDEVADDREGAQGRISDHTMAAVRKPLEAHKMRGKRCNKVLLTFYRYHRILFTAENEGRTLNARQHGEEIEGATLSARAGEPVVDLWAADGALHRPWISRRSGVDRESQAYPSLKCLCVEVSFEETAAGECPHLGPAQTFKQRDASLQMRVAGSFCTDEDQLAGVPGISRRPC